MRLHLPKEEVRGPTVSLRGAICGRKGVRCNCVLISPNHFAPPPPLMFNGFSYRLMGPFSFLTSAPADVPTLELQYGWG
jgi:hypothetical protein